MVDVIENAGRTGSNREDEGQLDAHSSQVDGRGWAWVAAGGGAVMVFVLGVDLLWVEAPNQPALARWMRVAADHPWRIWLAASAFWAAVWPSNLPFLSGAKGTSQLEPKPQPER